MKATMVGAEAVPFAKVGGLADVLGALIPELRKKGVDIRLFMPCYKSIKEKGFKLNKVLELPEIKLHDKSYPATIYHTTEPYPAYFVDGELFDREGVYTDPKTGEGYPDEPYRYIFFIKALLESLPKLDFKPDIYHLNDSHAALVSVFLKSHLADNPFYKDAGTLFTIHNIAYQGVWEHEVLNALGFGWDYFYATGPLEYYGKVNFVKAGIVFSDAISTVSPTYAEEITQSEEYGYGLEGILRARKDRLFGILNGVDYSVWNPTTDQLIPHNYSLEDLSGKLKNKEELLKFSGVSPRRKNEPLLGIVSRLVEQKGIELICQIAPKIFEQKANLIILGTGEKKYHDMLLELSKKYKKRLFLNLKYDNKLAHFIEAGSDFFLMPSKYEPCGLNQMYSLKYGTVPIVRKTGGLADTIVDVVNNPEEGYGFVFQNFTADDLWGAVKNALNIYKDKKRFVEIRKKAMELDFSWEVSAQKYIDLYNKVLQFASSKRE